MSGVDRELEESARSRSVPTPPPPLIQQTELNGRQRGGTLMTRLDHPLVDRCRTITLAPALTDRRQLERCNRIQFWLLEGLLPRGLSVPVIAPASQQLPQRGGGLTEARPFGGQARPLPCKSLGCTTSTLSPDSASLYKDACCSTVTAEIGATVTTSRTLRRGAVAAGPIPVSTM
jgi:hypothetical protein